MTSIIDMWSLIIHIFKKYHAHINVEGCNQSRSIKYLFKYINKGNDRVTASFYQSSTDGDSSHCQDEIKAYYDCRYLSPCEATWRIFAFDIQYRDTAVERLSFHLPDQQSVIFGEDDPIESIIDRPNIHRTKFLAWMEANGKYHEAKNLTYAEFPTKFVWKQPQHEWFPRKQGFAIGRLHFVPPGSGELYYLRILLNTSRGAISFVDLRTVNNVIQPTFRDACYSLGLLDDDKEYIDGIQEASHWGTANFLRNLFASLLLANQLSRPEFVWNSTWQCLSDDVLHKQRTLLRYDGIIL